MAMTRAKTITNGSGNNGNKVQAERTAATNLTSDPQAEEVLDDGTEPTEPSEPEAETEAPDPVFAAETTADAATTTSESEASTADDFNLEDSTESTMTTMVVSTPLSRQEAIARINSANHDLVEALLPLLSAGGATQKQLAALITRQLGLTESQTTELLYRVKQYLETKKQAQGSLIRSLIAEA